MGLFSKKTEKSTPVIQVDSSILQSQFSYPIQIKFWSIHREQIMELIKSLDINFDDFEDGKMYTYLRCKLVPDLTNESDPNAIKVFASKKGSRTFFDIGFIPSEFTSSVKEDNEKVLSKTHYWSLRMRIDIFNGLAFSLNIHESKFK